MTNRPIDESPTVEMMNRRPLPSFGLWLHQRRRAEGWQPEALAAAVGIRSDLIAQMEAGVVRPDKALAERLADLLGLSPADRDVFVLMARAAGGRTLGGGPWDSGRAGGRAAGNLTAPADPFLGRSVELSDLESWLTDGSTRLVTLLGPGGIGKTRLAREAGLRAAAAFPDGSWFVDLAVVTDPAGIGPAVARTLALRDNGGADPDRAVWTWLAGKRALLILDNVEQIIAGAADWVAATRQAAPTTTLLVTSRVALQLGDEQILPVAPLDLPERAPRLTPVLAMKSAAVALFVARAVEVQGQFRLTDANTDVVATICRRLDGMPLAIELAASRLTGTPAALLASLAQRLDLEAGGLAPTRSDRHKTLRAVVDWSYTLLTTAEQTLFRRLAVFGDWTRLEAVEAVCGPPDPAAPVFDSLMGLIGHSLVQMQVADDGGMVIGLLETIREYAAALPRPADEWDALVAAHRTYFRQVAVWGGQALRAGTDPRGWITQLTAAGADFNLALDRAFRAEESVVAGVDITVALLIFWERAGLWQDGTRWAERARAVPTLLPPTQAALTTGLGILRGLQGAREAARRLFACALAHCAVAGDRAGIAEIQLRQGRMALDDADWETAECLLTAAVAGYGELGDAYNQGRALNSLGALYLLRGRWDHARATYEAALVALAPSGDSDQTAIVLGNLGTVESEQGNLDRAEALLIEAVALRRTVQNPAGLATNLSQLAALLTERQAFDQVVVVVAESLRLRRHLGDQAGIVTCLNHLMKCAGGRGVPEEARLAAVEAITVSLSLEAAAPQFWTLLALLSLLPLLPDPAWGPRLLGRMTALGADSDYFILSPWDRVVWRRVEATRATRGAALYEVAFAEGQAAETTALLTEVRDSLLPG